MSECISCGYTNQIEELEKEIVELRGKLGASEKVGRYVSKCSLLGVVENKKLRTLLVKALEYVDHDSDLPETFAKYCYNPEGTCIKCQIHKTVYEKIK